MKIWHVGGFPSPEIVNGLNNTVWLVAKEQVLMGHKVSMIVTKINQDALDLSEQSGLNLIHISTTKWSYEPKLLKSVLFSQAPQIVHMHGIFSPEQATLALNLLRRGIPYVSTPHSITPQFLRRDWFKKSLYSLFIEKPRLTASSAITGVTPSETETINKFISNYRGIIRSISNPIEISKLDKYTWEKKINAKRLVYMGRFDVLHKGIDTLIEIARFLPEFEFHLYGNEDIKTIQWLENIKLNIPGNVYLHNPIFGDEKLKVLSEATLYIQASRWEAFGVSIAEAMYIGLPCAISNTHNIAETFSLYNLGCLFTLNPKEAACKLSELLNNQSEQLLYWSQNARNFAQLNFHPQTVASEYLNLYQEIIH
ncbi:glycosyltransferase family 4 protein [Calothrix sp. UHCC 0171]|uniref:glycosyltransferase family 4 protein n=1 Tax=Calothrix sp. UHCC 0171 TaxID=3110245 RepID=UPI002B1EED8E|nr:glycosyltransferase family 4 protein [Calothrix sp. UHCC 0171]MEA5573949.1 glycosyltransferase family 4 protein [Calothrix sp. UHCC 0171]